MMKLSQAGIRECSTDDALLDLLYAELNLRLPDKGSDLNLLMQRTSVMPIGLQAMVATFQLDVSLTLDDLGWHFGNWHHKGYCEKTIWGLRELGANEQSEIFAQAYAIVLPYWNEIGELVEKEFKRFSEWYSDSALEKQLDPLNRRMWQLQEIDGGLLGYWPRYARNHPDRVTDEVFGQ